VRARAVWAALREWALRLSGTLRGRRADDDLRRELDSHLELAEEVLRQRGYSPQEAARLARVHFGRADNALDSMRAQSSIPALSSFALDIKLGSRMLRKSWGLTLVGGMAITIATAIGVGGSEFVRDQFAPTLPLEDGDRIVRLVHVDDEAGGLAPASLYDLSVWRESVSSVEHLGAYITVEQGLVSDRGETGTVSLASISASAFEVTRVTPLLGRYLIDADDLPQAPPVVVVGYDVWQTLLGADPDPIGRTVQLSGTPTTVVGVMPERYGFPATQNAWVPLGVDPSELQPGSAPTANLFGRLAPGATLQSARSELAVVGRRAAADFPEIYTRLSPTVSSFAAAGPDGVALLILSTVRLVFILLLVVICANVATLVFARTVMREGEIAVRMALGATRRRIALQLVAETFVLVGAATLLGLLLARFALGHVSRIFFVIQQAPRPPFWWNDALSPTTIVYALVLAAVAALMIGVVPALKATGGTVHGRLGEHSSAARNISFGGIWTVMIVLQVALSVALLPLALSPTTLGAMKATAFTDPEGTVFPADEYVTAQLGRDALVPPRTPEERAELLESSRRLFAEVKETLAADPAVRSAALASGLSAMNHVMVPVEFVAAGPGSHVVAPARILLVDESYLDLMGATLVAGQPLSPADFAPESRSVVVNEAFVDDVLGGQNPVGGQLRFPERDGESSLVEVLAPGSSVDIVGVVRNPGIDAFGPGTHPVIYAPLGLAPVTPRAVGLVGLPQPPATQLFLRLAPDAGALGGRLHAKVAAIDPTLRVSQLGTAADAWSAVRQGQRIVAWIFLSVAAIVLLLSVAAVSALLSFTVSRRTREIAIRRAIGARREQIVSFVFRRVAIQLLAGIAIGSVIAVPVLWDGLADEGPRSLVIVSILLLGSGLAACVLPVRRALAIDPATAIKAD
jgi:putative ABC transport system permease protein